MALGFIQHHAHMGLLLLIHVWVYHYSDHLTTFLDADDLCWLIYDDLLHIFI